MVRLFHLDCNADEGYTPEFFLKLMFDGFSRCLFIDTGIDCSEQCQKNYEEFAGVLGLRHECTNGSLELIREAWLETKLKAAEIERTRSAGLLY